MKIGIDINGVLRDTIGKITQVYQKNFIDNSEDNFTIDTYQIDMSGNTEIDVHPEPFNYSMNLPVTSLNLNEHFSFQNKEEQFSFMYEEFAMEIFGHSPSSEMNTFQILNDLYIDLRENHEIYIISDEIGKSKPATLFFLSKFGCLIESIHFYNEKTKNHLLSSFDLIVTSNPDTIINYRNKSTIIKYNTDYNNDVDHTITINSITELKNKINAEII
jgi:hypothetical protein